MKLTTRSTIVPPIRETPRDIIWNSNVDLVVPRIHVETVYFYRPTGCPDFFDGRIIKEAIGKSLAVFYPMAGRLMRQEDGRVAIDCQGQGILFVEGEADATIDDFGDFAPQPAMQQLVPKVVPSSDISTYPLLVLQITKFKCGGAAFGVGMQHHVADGMSGIQFVNSISYFARGAPVTANPYMDRSLLKARDPPTPMVPHVEYQPPPPLFPSSAEKECPLTANGAHPSLIHNGGVHAHEEDLSRENAVPHSNGIKHPKVENGTEYPNGENGTEHRKGEKGTDHPKAENGTDHPKAENGTDHPKAENGTDHPKAENGTDHPSAENGTGHPKGENGAVHYNGLANGFANGAANGAANGSAKGSISSVHGKVREDEPGKAVAVVVLTKEKLAELKKKSQHADNTGRPYSTYEMLAGHIWKCLTKARGLDGSQPTKLYIATDGRARLVPRLPKDYFGNVVFTATPMSTAAELVHKPLFHTAGTIHDAVSRMDNDYLRSALDFLELQPDLTKLVRGAHTFRSPNLGITSWARLPVYDCDFGWGRPIFMGPSTIAYDGMIYILPSPTDDGSLSLSMCLRPDHMAKFKQMVLNVDDSD